MKSRKYEGRDGVRHDRLGKDNLSLPTGQSSDLVAEEVFK